MYKYLANIEIKFTCSSSESYFIAAYSFESFFVPLRMYNVPVLYILHQTQQNGHLSLKRLFRIICMVLYFRLGPILCFYLIENWFVLHKQQGAFLFYFI